MNGKCELGKIIEWKRGRQNQGTKSCGTVQSASGAHFPITKYSLIDFSYKPEANDIISFELTTYKNDDSG